MKKSSLILATLITVATPFSLSAATVYWDGNDINPGAGDTPTGAWLSNSWNADPLGEAPVGSWMNGDTAVFSAGTDAVNAYTVFGSGTSGAPGVTAAGVIIEDGLVTFSGGTLGLGAGFVTINAGAALSTDHSQRIASTVGSVWTLNGGTAISTNAGNAGSFIDPDFTIVLGPAGGTISHTVPNILNIVQTTTPISGPGPLTKTGPGVIAIASPSTYLGSTAITDGELRIRTSANRLPITTDVTVDSPGILNLNGLSQQIASLSGSGNVGTGSATLTISGAASTTFTGALKNLANAGAGAVPTGNGRLVKNGVGVITFAGLNDINGSVTLNDGGIIVDPGASLCGPIADVTVNAGTLTLNNAAQSIENLAGTGGVINLAAVGHVLTSNPIASTTYSGTITGPGGLARLNSNATTRTLTLNGPNDYGGNTLISAGIISVGSASALGSTLGYTEVSSGAEALFTGAAVNFTVAEPFRIAGAGNTDGGAISIIASATPTLSGPVTLIGDATVTVSSTATVSFSNANAFTSLLNENLTLQGGSGAGGGGTISGVIALGSGGLTKLQGGRWTLTAANTYSGTTTIGAGTLQLGNGLAGNDGTISSSVNVVNNGALEFNRFGSDAYAGAISGRGTVIKVGAGTQTLSGANSFSGTTEVSEGTLRLGNATALGFGGIQTISTAASVVSSGATLDLNGSGAINEPIVLSGAGFGGIGAMINNSGTLAIIGGGIAGAQVAAVTGTGTGYSTAPTVAFNGTGSGATATVTLGVTAASFTVNLGDKFYTTAPTVTISGGSGVGATAVAVLSSGSAGTLIGIDITNAGTGYTTAPTIAFGAGTFTSGTISGSGVGNATEFTVSGIAMTDAGTGYTGIPTYTFGSGNATPGTLTLSSVTLAENSTLGGSGDIAINSAIVESGGARTLTKIGVGTVSINGPQSYSALAANDGRITLNSSLSNATITNGAGALLNVNANASGSSVTVDGSTEFSVSQTLASLDIGVTGVVTLGSPDFAGGPETIAAPDGWFGGVGAPIQPVPEPGSFGLLVLGALGILARRRAR